MVAGFDLGFVKLGFRIGLGFNYASRFKTGLVGYDLASLSLSLSLTHTHTHIHTHMVDLVDGSIENCVCDLIALIKNWGFMFVDLV